MLHPSCQGVQGVGHVLDRGDEDQVVTSSSPPGNQVHGLLLVLLDTMEYATYSRNREHEVRCVLHHKDKRKRGRG